MVKQAKLNKDQSKLGISSSNQQKLILNRKLGFEGILKSRTDWQALTHEKQQCWVHHNHMMTIFIWCEDIGLISQSTNPDEVAHYQNALSFPDSRGVPQICGEFTDWQARPMVELEQYVIDNDVMVPDFVGELLAEEKVHTRVEEFMSEKELFLVKKRKADYYKHNSLMKIQDSVKFTQPQYVLTEAIQFVLNSTEHRDSLKLWVYTEFVKPGP